jgi:hypothetical protein
MQVMGDGSVCDNDNQNYEWIVHEAFTKVKFATLVTIFTFKPIDHHFQY